MFRNDSKTDRNSFNWYFPFIIFYEILNILYWNFYIVDFYNIMRKELKYTHNMKETHKNLFF